MPEDTALARLDFDFAFRGRSFTAIEYRGVPVFVAAEVCRLAEYEDPKAVQRAVRASDEYEQGIHHEYVVAGPDEVRILREAFAGESNSPANEIPEWLNPKTRSLMLLTEAGLNLFLVRSDKSLGKQLRRWLAHEVLPALRKHGRYESQRLLAVADREIIDLQRKQLAVLEDLAAAHRDAAAAHREAKEAIREQMMTRRPRPEKREDVLDALCDRQRCALSSRQIAKELFVSHTYVNRLRARYGVEVGDVLTRKQMNAIDSPPSPPNDSSNTPR